MYTALVRQIRFLKCKFYNTDKRLWGKWLLNKWLVIEFKVHIIHKDKISLKWKTPYHDFNELLMLLGNFPRDQAFPFLKHANIQIYARVLREYVESTGLDILAYLLIDIHCSWYICQPNYGIRNAEVRKENLIYQIFLFLTLQLFIGLMQIFQMKIIVVIILFDRSV